MRKHLGFGAEEWQALPWYWRRMYVEELTRDLSSGKQAPMSPLDDDLSRFGLRVNQV